MSIAWPKMRKVDYDRAPTQKSLQETVLYTKDVSMCIVAFLSPQDCIRMSSCATGTMLYAPHSLWIRSPRGTFGHSGALASLIGRSKGRLTNLRMACTELLGTLADPIAHAACHQLEHLTVTGREVIPSTCVKMLSTGALENLKSLELPFYMDGGKLSQLQ